MKRILVFIISITVFLFVQNYAESASQKNDDPSMQSPLSGKVADTMDSGGYTYVELDQDGKKTWVALPKTKVKKGQMITVRPGMVMENFESKTLKRKFDRIIFSGGIIDDGTPGGAGEKKSEGSKGNVPAVEKISVGKAAGPDAYTIAELYKNRDALKGKSVSVKAKVIKVSSGIMKMNWVHLQDGSGDPKTGSHDIVATSAELPAAGDIVTVKGTLGVDKDFGSGYKYSVLIEKAAFAK
jgi:hypothetical protein